MGSGQIDMPGARTAMKSGASLYYIEDESADPWGTSRRAWRISKSSSSRSFSWTAAPGRASACR